MFQKQSQLNNVISMVNNDMVQNRSVVLNYIMILWLVLAIQLLMNHSVIPLYPVRLVS